MADGGGNCSPSGKPPRLGDPVATAFGAAKLFDDGGGGGDSNDGDPVDDEERAE